MEKKNQNEELQSRREFFKKAAKGALPILGAVVLAGNPLLTKAAEEAPMGCRTTCSGTCRGNCHYTCSGTCRGNCLTTCTGTCEGNCKFTCSGSCKNTCEGTCSRSSR